MYTYYRVGSDGLTQFGNEKNTKIAEHQRVIDDQIMSTLNAIINELADFLESHKVDSKTAALRVTILAPTKDGPEKAQYLIVTDYRYVTGEPSTSTNIAYRVSPAAPEGISVIAYATNRPAVIVELPDRFLEWGDYLKRLGMIGLTQNMVAKFRRPCRAFIAVPFNTAISKSVRFVLTLDSLVGLFPIDSDEIKGIIARMQRSCERLGLLLEMKQPLPRTSHRTEVT